MINHAGCYERSKSSGTDCIQITVCDINYEMLRVREEHALIKYGNDIIDVSRALQFHIGNAQDLYQYNHNEYYLYTIAFGLRTNVIDTNKALEEAHRVLKPGDKFICMELSPIVNTDTYVPYFQNIC